MIVLGIDPGTRHLGWGVLETVGTRTQHVAHGVIDTNPDESIASRLCVIEQELLAVVEHHRPSAAAVESIFFAKDAMAAAKLGHARGVILLVLARAGIPIFEYEPARVKRAVVGTGRAEKQQVARVLATLLKLGPLIRPDAADALAIALVHARAAPVAARLAEVRAAFEAQKKAATRRSRRASFVR